MVRRLSNFFKNLSRIIGPGLVTGAADDDPSGIATYSIAGANLGLSLLWTALLTWPLMAAVQMMCARIGLVTGKGLAAALRRKIPKPILILMGIALLLANIFNIAADLSAMADAAQLLSGLSAHIFVILFAALISWATIQFRYAQIANTLKWLALVLFSYVWVAFLVGPDWKEVFHATFFPSLPHGKEEWQTLVAILGTTISPYLFFWQTAEEVEEKKSSGLRSLSQRRGATQKAILERKLDVGVGTLLSNLVMFFIILTTALTLHRHGLTSLETSAQVAEALRPLAGNLAMLLYTVGLLSLGVLAIPTLTGSAAYALAETFAWREGLDAKWNKAKAFYAVILFASFSAVLLSFLNINPVQALYWSAVVNGLLAPFLLVAILWLACDPVLMNGQPSSLLGKIMVGFTTVLMFLAAIGMFVF